MATALRERAGHESTDILQSILHLLRDDQFQFLLSRLSAKRGRPLKRSVKFDNRLLLQLHVLRSESFSLKAIQTLFDHLCEDTDQPSANIAHLIQSCLYQLKSVSQANDINIFLSKELEFDWIGEYSKMHSVTKSFLLSIDSEDFVSPSVISSDKFVSKGFLLELNQFRQRKGFTLHRLLTWLKVLCPKFKMLTTVELQKLVTKISVDVKKKQKRKGYPGGAKCLQDFKDSQCFTDEGDGESVSVCVSCPTDPTITQTNAPPQQHISVSQPRVHSDVEHISNSMPMSSPTFLGQSTDCVMMDKLTENVSNVLSEKMSHSYQLQEHQIRELKEVVTERNNSVALQQKEISLLERAVERSKADLESSKRLSRTLKAQLRLANKKCTKLKRSNVNRRYLRLKQKYAEKTASLGMLEKLDSDLASEKKKKRLYQKYASKVQIKHKKLLHELHLAEDTILTLLDEINNKPVILPRTKTDSGFFKDFVLKCVYELVGECEVPASRCREVIKTVCKHFFNVHFSDDALPGKTTSLRFADQSHCLSKLQIAEALSSHRFDLHADGTSKKNRKFVGMQVSLEDKNKLSLGFDPVASETAQTVLELATSKLAEFAVLLSPHDDAEAEMKKLLRNLVGLMTDRASNMKCLGRLLDQHRAATLQEEIQLEYLHCNAHFLLGISTAAEKALVRTAKEEGLDGQLGRDKLPAFQNFTTSSSESAVCRYVRMACDILGPRGDEKNGCQADWMAYCASMEKTSHLSSFRANRFNNLFEAAAGLIHHRQDIESFFQLRAPTNLKQKSVLADSQCKDINTMLLVLGLMYVYFTGPFWVFVRSDIHYLDQYTFIQPMHSIMQELKQHPDMLLHQEEIPDTLDTVRLRNSPTAESVLQARDNTSQDDKHLLLKGVKMFAEEFVVVVERQLIDFLPGGKYGSPPSDADRLRMAHCQLTNLLGEACFADLDYTMFKSRRATLHHHSTLNMMKRNHTVTMWLDQKSAEEQAKLICRARKLGPQMRVSHKQKELIVLQEIREQMERKKIQEEEFRQRKEEKLRNQKQRIILAVTEQGGPCQDPESFLKMLQANNTKVAKLKAVKAQVDYEKFVMGCQENSLEITTKF